MNNMIHHSAMMTVSLVALLLVTLNSTALAAPTIWDGPSLTFTKVGFADPTLPENQDRITDNVWITRGGTGGIYNAAVEASYDMIGNTSPSGTLWAFGTTDNLDSLVFGTWRTTVSNNPPGSLNRDMVLHLVEDDIYLDLRFLSWGGQPQGGSFSYVRSTGTVIPEPSTIAMVAGAFVAVVGWRRWAK
jgi:hypothetical protein